MTLGMSKQMPPVYWITADQLAALGHELGKSGYGQYLMRMASESAD